MHICIVCGVNQKTSSRLAKHSYYHEDSPEECDECGKMLPNKIGLNDHKRKVHAEKSKCDLCLFEGSKSSVVRHKKTVHQEASNRFKCLL